MGEAKSPASSTPARHFISGLGSGVASAVILQPLDLLKTRVQQSGSSSLSACLADLRKSPHLFRNLWRGTAPSALRTGFGSAIYFTLLNTIRQRTKLFLAANQHSSSTARSSALPALPNWANLVSGAAARTFAGFILMPLTVIKVRFESNMYSYSSIASAAADIRRHDGFRGFFAGFGATAIRDAPYAAHEKSSTSHGEATLMGASTASFVNFTSGITAGAACSAMSNPFDAVKTRIQLQPQRYHNIWHAASKMVRKEGFRSLWDGLALRMSRKALSSALAWTVYEELIRRFSQV